MTSISARLSGHPGHRRRFGADMASVGLILKPFAALADAEGAEWITTGLFLRWTETFGSASSNARAGRPCIVRGFASWLHGIDDRSEVPPKGLIPRRGTRPRPWIRTEAEIERIAIAAAALPSRSGLRGATCPALFGLIAVTGLRIGEALGLDDRDVDAVNATLSVRHAKSGKCRVIPVARCVVAKPQACRQFRDHVVAHAGSGALFQAGNGKRTSACSAEWNFARVGQAIGLRRPSPGRGRGPRIRDLRRATASPTIPDWFRQGRDVDAEMCKLGACPGHENPSGTWRHIEAVPELPALAGERGLRTLGEGGAS